MIETRTIHKSYEVKTTLWQQIKQAGRESPLTWHGLEIVPNAGAPHMLLMADADPYFHAVQRGSGGPGPLNCRSNVRRFIAFFFVDYWTWPRYSDQW